MTDPTDAKIEAMAEKLWEEFTGSVAGYWWRIVPWSSLVRNNASPGYAPYAAAFRAMARVALEGTPNGDEVRG